VDSQEVAAMRRLTKLDVEEGRGAAAEQNVSGEEEEKEEEEEEAQEVLTAEDVSKVPEFGKLMLKRSRVSKPAKTHLNV